MTDTPMDDAVPETDPSADWRARAEAAEAALAREQHRASELAKHAALKIAAIRAGMIDLDGLKLLDFDKVELAEDGTVPNATAMIADLRKSKAWLFGSSSSSSVAAAPRAQSPRARHAREMSEAEWRAARASLIR
ncbi:hypothetical protein ACOSOMT5_P1529 [Acidiphilium sp. MT5]